MLKNILKLDGAQQLSKNEQKEISGGKRLCSGFKPCCGEFPAGTLMPDRYGSSCPLVVCDSSC
jgi:hypothetical protein